MRIFRDQSNLTDGQKTKNFLSNQTSEDSEFAAAAQLAHLCQSHLSHDFSFSSPYAQEPFGLAIFLSPHQMSLDCDMSFLYQFRDTANRPLPLLVPYCIISVFIPSSFWPVRLSCISCVQIAFPFANCQFVSLFLTSLTLPACLCCFVCIYPNCLSSLTLIWVNLICQMERWMYLSYPFGNGP